jgi:predicted DNA-binding transcriptional regulator AlpA
MEHFRMSSNPQKFCRTSMTRSLNTVEAAEMLGVRPSTLRGWKAQRVGPPFIQLSPRCVRYAESDIQTYANERRVVPCVRETGRRHEAR